MARPLPAHTAEVFGAGAKNLAPATPFARFARHSPFSLRRSAPIGWQSNCSTVRMPLVCPYRDRHLDDCRGSKPDRRFPARGVQRGIVAGVVPPMSTRRHPSRALRLRSLVSFAVLLSCAACTRDPETVKARALERAARHEQSGALAAAIIEYRNAVQAVPGDGQAHLKLAEAYSRGGDAARASLEYSTAADLLPDNPDAQLSAGNLALLGGRFDEAAGRAERLLAMSVADVSGHQLMASALAGLGRFEEAVKEAGEVIRLAPARSTGYVTLGAIEVRRRQPAAAERAFVKATEIEPAAVAPYLALADFYWSRDQPREAEATARRALAAEPDNLLAHQLLAGVAAAIGDDANAERHLTRVVELSADAEARFALADFYARRNRGAQATKVLEALGPDPPAGTETRLARLEHQSGNTEAAYARLDRILARDGGNTGALIARSSLLLADGKDAEAAEAAQQAVRSGPASADAHFALGRARDALDDRPGAESSFNEALRLNPAAAPVWLALSGVQLATGKLEPAAESARRATQAGAEQPAATLALVRAEAAVGNLASAGRHIKRLETDFPDRSEVRLMAGRVLARTGDATGARRELERVLVLDPGSIEALNELTALDVAERRFDAALDRLNPFLAKSPGSATLNVLAARVHLGQGDAESAERLLGLAVDGGSPDPGALSLLGQLAVQQGRSDEGVAFYDRLAAAMPNPANALTMAGMVRQQQGRLEEAQERFERALQADPDAVLAANNLAWLYAQQGLNLDRAVALALTAYSKRPEDSGIVDTLGFAYYRRGMLPEAVETLQKAVRLSPRRALYHHHLGFALADAGRAEEATTHLQRVLALDPVYPDRQAVEDRLNSMPVQDQRSPMELIKG